MRKPELVLCLVTLVPLAATQGSLAAERGEDSGRHWPQWRGPLLSGVAPHARPPIEWSESKNVRFKVEIPGKGSATPIVWGDRIYVLTAVPGEKRTPVAPATTTTPATPGAATTPAPAAPAAGAPPAGGPTAAAPAGGRGPRSILPEATQKFTILALRRTDGQVLWQRVLREELPHEGTHPTGTWASASAMTDGELVFAHFGSRGLYALDTNGTLLWEKDLGDMTVKLSFGEGSSPALGGDRLFVQWDHEGESFIVALERKTGREVWRQKREERTSWATPLVVEHGGRTQVVTSATNRVRSYDAQSGELLWETSGMTENAIPTPVHANGLVILTSGFRGNALLAVKLAEASGDLGANRGVAWKLDRDTPYVPSPLLYGDLLYVLKGNNGLLSCFDAQTGERHYGPERLEGVPNVYASPLGADGRVYVAGREGTTAVIQRGPVFKVLATNVLEDGFDASPVAVGSDLYLRGQRFLYRISE